MSTENTFKSFNNQITPIARTTVAKVGKCPSQEVMFFIVNIKLELINKSF